MRPKRTAFRGLPTHSPHNANCFSAEFRLNASATMVHRLTPRQVQRYQRCDHLAIRPALVPFPHSHVTVHRLSQTRHLEQINEVPFRWVVDQGQSQRALHSIGAPSGSGSPRIPASGNASLPQYPGLLLDGVPVVPSGLFESGLAGQGTSVDAIEIGVETGRLFQLADCFYKPWQQHFCLLWGLTPS